MNDVLRDLAQRIGAIESNRHSGERSALSLGIASLDACLPQERLPAGSLVELLQVTPGSGAWSLALLMAREACAGGRALVICDPERCWYPPAAAGWGLDLDRLIILRPADTRAGQAAVGQALRCSAVGAVISGQSSLRTIDFRRLQAAAEAGQGIGLLLRPVEAKREPSFAALRLLVTPVATTDVLRRIQVDVLRCRGGRCRSLVLEVDDETGHVRLPAGLAASAVAPRAARAGG